MFSYKERQPFLFALRTEGQMIDAWNHNYCKTIFIHRHCAGRYGCKINKNATAQLWSPSHPTNWFLGRLSAETLVVEPGHFSSVFIATSQ